MTAPTLPARTGFLRGLDVLTRVAQHFAPDEVVSVSIGHNGRLTVHVESEAYAIERAAEFGFDEDEEYRSFGQRWWSGEWRGASFTVCVIVPEVSS